MNHRLEVYPYTIDTLREVIAEKSKNSSELIKEKLHHQYFEGYCADIGVTTIVVESHYVDQHYLEDYSAYYVRCHKEYERYCTRIHLFREEFSDQDVNQYLSGSNDDFEDKLKSSYLGFVVIKPLPRTVIGRTCLSTYPEENRNFPSVREYEANLYGTVLRVKSLAFQEQDRVVAACATSALWSVFQGTGKEFQHVIPSPVQITRAATEKMPIESRILPSRGLSTAMMAHAIRHVGLEPDLVKVEDEYILTSTLYAYLKGRIPMILGIELWDTSVTPNKTEGFHAVAVTGYSICKEDPEPLNDAMFHLKASRIGKLYVHDDQVGPFARMILDDIPIIVGHDGDNEPITVKSLSTSWTGENGEIGSIRARPSILLIPLYHKVRIPLRTVHDTVLSFDVFLEALRPIFPVPYDGRLEWDIFLTTNNDLKTDVREDRLLNGEYLSEFLLQSLPKYLWRATARHNDAPLIDLIFDATDIEQGMFFVRALEYDADLSVFLRVTCKAAAVERLYSTTSEWKIIVWFKDQTIEGLDVLDVSP